MNYRTIVPTLVLMMSMALYTTAMRAATVKLTQGADSIKVEIDGKEFTTYHFLAGNDKNFLRPFAYPVYAADGQAVTSDQEVTNPKEHPHHRSFWVAQGSVNGVDHWANKGHHQRHIGFDKVEGDTIVERLEWEGATPDAPTLLKETRTLRFFALDDGTRGIDLTVVFTPTKDAVTFGDTKEAGIVAVRMSPEIGNSEKGAKHRDGVLTNSAGAHGEKAIWGKPADWCDESGMIGGKPYGVAIFDHPDNPRHPSRWHTREYGLHAANIFGLHDYDPKNTPKGAGDLTLEPGKTLTFKYRVLFHQGDAASAKLDERYKEWTAGK
ncbi:MAG TPA: PmoA family protein [Tepidisphaeraceae bacterium]|jgi:hypothetical protein